MVSLTVTLTDLRMYAHHGVFPQEGKVGNEFSVDISVTLPASEKLSEDSLDGTISYAELYDIVTLEMQTPRKLLETVAWSIRHRIIKKWKNVSGGEIRIGKTRPPIQGIIGEACVTIKW